MKAQQLSLFQQGQDLPLFNAERPAEMPDCPLCQQSTEWHHYPDGAPSVVTCRQCGSLWASPDDIHQPKPKRKRRARKVLRYTVKMTFQDKNMPAWIQAEPTEEKAGATMRHWFATIAGIRSIMIEDSEQQQRHIYTPTGYMFTVPII